MANLFGEVWQPAFYTPGDPAFPTEFTDPNAPVTIVVEGDGSDAVAGMAESVVAFFSSAARSIGGISQAGKVGAAVGGYSDWFVDRIWIDPSPIEFGSIIGSRVVPVTIFSTYRFDERTLEDIDLSALGDGISVLNDPTPYLFVPLSSLIVEIEATTEGPPQFSDFVVFEFDHQDIPILATGLRLILFSYLPEQPIVEQLRWVTDILKRRDGTEQRRSLRTVPRSKFRLRFRMGEDDDVEFANRLRTLIMRFRALIFGLPIWHEMRQVTSAVASPSTTIPFVTADMDLLENTPIMIYEPATGAAVNLTIASIAGDGVTITEATTADISADALVIPIRRAYITREPEFSDGRYGYVETLLEFEVVDNTDYAFADQTALEAAFPVNAEDGLPMLTDPNVLSGVQSRKFETRHSRLDAEIGGAVQFPMDPLSSIDGNKGARLESLADIRKWRSLLHWLRGSWGAFYLPTFRRDLVLAEPFALNNATITVKNSGISQFFGVQQPHEFVMLILSDGRQFVAQLNSASEVDGGANEELLLVDPFDDTDTTVIQPEDARIGWLELVRIDGDAATLEHERPGEASLTFSVRTVKQ